MDSFMTKDFGGQHGLGRVEYVRCRACWLVASRTHAELPDDAWLRLNEDYHAYLGTGTNSDDPNWGPRLAAQAESLAVVQRAGIAAGPWLDYGAGDGSLSKLLGGHDVAIENYDRYLPQAGFLSEQELATKRFGLVLTTSVYEHVRSMEPLQEIEQLLADGGVQAVHTEILPAIPRDPDWHYLLPVHTAFFTYRSFELLMERWGYGSSAYAIGTGMWLLYRQDATELEERLAADARRFVVAPGMARAALPAPPAAVARRPTFAGILQRLRQA